MELYVGDNITVLCLKRHTAFINGINLRQVICSCLRLHLCFIRVSPKEWVVIYTIIVMIRIIPIGFCLQNLPIPIKGLSFPFLIESRVLLRVPSLSPLSDPFLLSSVPISSRRSGGIGRGSRSDRSSAELAGVMSGSAGSGSSASTRAPTDTCSSTILRSFACQCLPSLILFKIM